MKLTRDLPKSPGYYWYCNFGEHTPTIVQVTRDGKSMWAQNEEFAFKIERVDLREIAKTNREVGLEKNSDGFFHGEQLWCRIPDPALPNGKVIKPDSY